jgi:ketosteroid isomerase-like protein
MRSLLLATSLIIATAAMGSAFAQSTAPNTNTNTAAQARAATPVSPATREAVQVVNDFMGALASGQLEAARQFMTPDALVIANGQVLGNRDEYINGAAKGDSAALRNVQRELLNRDAGTRADSGWVVSEKRMRAPAGTKGPSELVLTETMLLARTSAGWKIAHIHWSGRRPG